MANREASCSCGQLRVSVQGEPLRISICHCLGCQRRTGSAFSVQARFEHGRVRVTGRSREFTRVSDEGGERRSSHFCPECGATVYLTAGGTPGVFAIPVGAFADPAFPPPTVSVWEERKHEWVTLPAGIRHVP
jgi:hypothetical protein